MKAFSLIIFLLVCNFSFAQTETYEKGNIIDHIPVKGSAGETFALYLPETYNPNTLSAIVFIFDPSGRGANGIKSFIKSAERFNYVLVCSNNTKNGPYQENFDYTNRMFTHVFSNFNIDEKQIYAAGFSGGSRLACTVAVLTGAIQGVIACGAGFPNEMDKKPSPVSQFSYVGLVGDEDMNYQEMFNVKDWLNKFKIDNELFTYEDTHRWPPEVQIERAFKWFELQAYKRKLRKTNAIHMNSFYEEDLEIADSLSKNQVFRAMMEYKRLKRNYTANKNIGLVSEKIKALKKSKRYKDELKIREKIAGEEYKLSEKLLSKFRQESSYGESRDNYAWWRRELKKLDENYVKSDDYFTRKMGKRLHYRLQAVAFETSMIHRNTRRLDKAVYCDKLLVLISPDQPWTYYRLAETHAMNNDAKNTRINLQFAVDKGFKQYNRITSNPLFSKFKGDKKFDIFLSTLN